MSQRWSEYERKDRDLYETPEWVTDCVIDFIQPHQHVWEPAVASGKIANRLHERGFQVTGTDIDMGIDFLQVKTIPEGATAIVTNPPFNQANAFIEHSLKLMEPVGGVVAMLLRTDFDHAKTRQHLFRDNIQFWYKIMLLQRIKWFPGTTGNPSYNHAWFVWNWKNKNPLPCIAYRP